MPREMTFDKKRPASTRVKQPVEKLRASRWWKPTLERFKVYLESREKLGCDDVQALFAQFADEIMSAPEAIRDGMLAVEEVAPYVPFQRYPAYIAPTMEEQKLDFYSQAMGRKLR